MRGWNQHVGETYTGSRHRRRVNTRSLATVLLQSPAPTQTVDELMASPADHLDQEVAVRGEVRDGTIDNSSMTLSSKVAPQP